MSAKVEFCANARRWKYSVKFIHVVSVFVSLFNPQFDKNGENVNGSRINIGACNSLSARKMWNNCVPSPGRLFQGDGQEAIFYQMLQFGHIIHSTYCCQKRHKWSAAGHVKRVGLLLDGTGGVGGGHGGGERGESQVMDRPTSCRGKVWLMAVH